MALVQSHRNLPVVVIRGGGDLGSGVAYRLYVTGYPLVITELEHPLLVRRAVSFGSAMFDGMTSVEGITARRIESTSAVWLTLNTDEIPVLLDTDDTWRKLKPRAVIDARVAKRNIDTTLDDAELVIGLGPGFVAGEDCHVVIETNRGHRLGRVIRRGGAEPNTGVPGNVMGAGARRVLRAPAPGYVIAQVAIGDHVAEGQVVATVGEASVTAPFDGVVRGLIHESVVVDTGVKIGDIDPRAVRENCFIISEKSLAIGGGVLEALLTHGIHPLPLTELARGSHYAAL
ncbi:MAG: EF2563 family selenium-dependent molybdenum hydroxylase system protein [Chloroflexi bacterium]|nr:EF2563 family selenium-dependent molybdenum hydroxylase system protein [Chloroflexota bacterium]